MLARGELCVVGEKGGQGERAAVGGDGLVVVGGLFVELLDES